MLHRATSKRLETTHKEKIGGMNDAVSTGTSSKYEAGCVVWVWVVDKAIWWPGVVLKAPDDSDIAGLLIGEGFDCYVKLLQFGGDEEWVLPLNSRDKHSIQRLRWSSLDTDDRFSNPEVSVALEEARRLRHSGRRGEPMAGSSVTPASASSPMNSDTASAPHFTNEELVKIESYLAALSEADAAVLRQELGLTSASSMRASRRPQPPPVAPRPAPSSSYTAMQPPQHSTTPPASQERLARQQQVKTDGTGGGGRDARTQPLLSDLRDRRPSFSTCNAGDMDGTGGAPSALTQQPAPAPSALETVEIFDADSLEVLRMEVFDNRDRFVLDPIYALQAVLGAVSVPVAGSFRAELPTRRFLFTQPHRPGDRMLLVAIGSDYDHSLGWFESVVWEGAGGTLEASISVNGHAVATPVNWRLSASKEPTAVKTVVPVDITDIIECTLPDEEAFELKVEFSHVLPDVQLWDAILVCILVEQKCVTSVCDEIKSVYHSPAAFMGSRAVRGPPAKKRHRHEADGPRVEAQCVSAKCPLTSMPLSVPCRGARCEHVQCMELEAVVRQCLQLHVWNCPMCHAPMEPSHVVVDHVLMEELGKVSDKGTIEAVMFNPTSYHYSLKLKSVVKKCAETVVDDDDD